VEGIDVSLNNHPAFILTDQNFPPMAPVGGGCLKIVQVENTSLTDLVELFLVMTRGFDMPAGAVLLLSSPSYAALIGMADYTAEFVHAFDQLRGAIMGGVNVLNGIPFLLGGIVNTAAIMALSEIEHWVTSTGNGTDDISTTRIAFMVSIFTDKHVSSHQQIIRLLAL
jgi:hypothetical protein